MHVNCKTHNYVCELIVISVAYANMYVTVSFCSSAASIAAVFQSLEPRQRQLFKCNRIDKGVYIHSTCMDHNN